MEKTIYRLETYHDRPILSLDWAISNPKMKDNDGAKTCRIVSCGEDCRSFVWEFNKKDDCWRANPIFLEQNSASFASLHCEWNKNGDKIVLAMGGNHKSASLQVCSFHKNTNEWISTQIGRRRIKSSVLSVAWRPKKESHGNDFVASGGCDKRCRVFDLSVGNRSVLICLHS